MSYITDLERTREREALLWEVKKALALTDAQFRTMLKTMYDGKLQQRNILKKYDDGTDEIVLEQLYQCSITLVALDSVLKALPEEV